MFCGGIKVGVFFFYFIFLLQQHDGQKVNVVFVLFKIFSFAKDKIAQSNVKTV